MASKYVSGGDGGEGPVEGTGQSNNQQGGSVARRPMNAFLIFCKRHRGVVKSVYPHLENRAITKILGEWWANLKESDKACYTDLASQYKEAYMKSHPDFRWYKMPTASSSCRPMTTRPKPMAQSRLVSQQFSQGPIVPGKLADESQLGGLSSLLAPVGLKQSLLSQVPKPPKKRYLEANYTEQGTSYIGEFSNGDIIKKETAVSHSSELCKIELNMSDEYIDVKPDKDKVDRMMIWRKGLLLSKSRDFEDNVNNWDCKKEEDEDETEEMKCSVYRDEVNNNSHASRASASSPIDDDMKGEEEEGRREAKARACKGRRYREFMYNSVINRRKSSSRWENNLEMVETVTSVQLRRKCREKSNEEKKMKEEISNSSASTSICGDFDEGIIKQEPLEEASEIQENDFNLDEKIHALPFLSIEDFQIKKKAKKKGSGSPSPSKVNTRAGQRSLGNRNQIVNESLQKNLQLGAGITMRTVFVENSGSDSCNNNNCNSINNNKVLVTMRGCVDRHNNNNVMMGTNSSQPLCGHCVTGVGDGKEIEKAVLVGSRKRKARRQDIRRLQPGTSFKDTSVVEVAANDNLGLVTLADVAAKKQKLGK